MSRRPSEDEIATAEAAAAESRRRAERDAAEGRAAYAEASSLTARLDRLNASNGFAEMLFDAVVRGAR